LRKPDAFVCKNGHGPLVKDQIMQAYVCGRCDHRVSYEDLYRMGINP